MICAEKEEESENVITVIQSYALFLPGFWSLQPGPVSAFVCAKNGIVHGLNGTSKDLKTTK